MKIQGIPFPLNEQSAGGRESTEKLSIEELDRQQEYEQEMVTNVIQTIVEKNERNDKAEISEDTSQDEAEKEQITKLLAKLFEKLEAWQPSFRGNAVKDLEQLKEFYALMLEKIMQIPGEEGQKALLAELEIQIVKALAQYSAKYLGTTDGFFKQFGSTRDNAALLNTLFKTVTGRCLTAAKINTILELYRKASAPESQAAARTNGQPSVHTRARAAFENTSINLQGTEVQTNPESPPYGAKERTLHEHRSEGFLYSRTVTEKPPLPNSAFSEKQLAKADYMGTFHSNSAKGYSISEGLSADFMESPSKPGIIFNSRDLNITEQFLTDFLGENNLLKNSEISARNPEVKCLLAAATWLKADTFLQTAGIQTGLRSSVSQSVDKMIHFYVSLAAKDTDSPAAPGYKTKGESPKESPVYTLYHQIKLICQKEKNAGNALTAGLKYAYELFEKHKSDDNFFFLHSGNAKSDCKKGFLLLKRNWKHFTDKLPVSMHEKKELDYSFQSPWGMYITPAPLPNITGKYQIFIGGAIIIVVIILCFLFT